MGDTLFSRFSGHTSNDIRDFHSDNPFYSASAASVSEGSPKACSFHEENLRNPKMPKNRRDEKNAQYGTVGFLIWERCPTLRTPSDFCFEIFILLP